MAVKIPKPQPPTRDKTCTICGETYTYPESGSRASRFHCDLCVDLSSHAKKVLSRMARRISSLERELAKLKSKS